MNNHTYRDYFDIDEGYFPCVNESAIHSGFEWKNTYPHQTFIDMLEKMERVLARQEKRSLWIEGAYGTGKSQCAYAMKKILEVSEAELRAYWNKYEPLKKKHDLLEKIVGHTQKGIITAHRYASGSIHSPRDMFLAIQDSVKTALVKAKLNTGENTLKESVIAWLEDEDHKSFLDNLLKNPEKEWKAVFSQTSAEEVLSQLRKSGQVESLMNNLFRLADKEGITALNINADRLIAWIKDIIDSNDIKIVLIWDEFSDYFKNNRASLSEFQKLAELVNEKAFYFVIVTHEIGQHFAHDDTTWKKVRDRFIPVNITLPDNIAFDLIGHAFNVKDAAKQSWDVMADDLNSRVDASRNAVMKVADIRDPQVMKNIMPIHPIAALLLKNIASAFQSNQRSMFEFIKTSNTEDVKAFQWFIEYTGPLHDHPLLTVDMLWNFFYEKGKDNLTADIRLILDTFPQQPKLREDEKAVLKAILIMQAIDQRLGGTIELFKATEQHLSYVFEGISSGLALEDTCKNIAKRLKEQGILVLNPISGGRHAYVVAVLAGDQTKIDKHKSDVRQNSTTAKLVSDGELATVLSLSPALRLRFESEAGTGKVLPVTVADFTRAINSLREKTAGWKFHAVIAFAKDDAESSIFRTKIKEAVSDKQYENIVFIDALSSPLGAELFEQYVEHSAMALYHSGSNRQESQRSAEKARNILSQEWKNRIYNGQFIVYRYANQEGEKLGNGQGVSSVLQTIVMNRFPRIFDFAKGLSENQLKLTQAKPSALCGIAQSTSQVVVSIEKHLLPTVWKAEKYWENPATSSLPISRLKIEVDKLIEYRFDCEGHISIGDVYDFLEQKYGFAPCNVSAFVTGFLLKEYGGEPYRYSDSSSGHDSMTKDKLAEMIGNYIGKSPKPTYLVKMTGEERAFYELTESAWRITPNSCSSVSQAAHAITAKMRGFALPVWCLAEVDEQGVFDIVQKYIELTQKEGAEAHKKAVEIGKVASTKSSLRGNVAALLSQENFQKGMMAFLQSFEDGKILALAKIIGAEGVILADIRRLFEVKHACLWEKQTGKDEIRKLLTEYGIVKQSNSILDTSAHSLADTFKAWRERLKFFTVSCEALRVQYPLLLKVLDISLKIYQQTEILPEQQKTFLSELTTHHANMKELLFNERQVFAEVYQPYLEDLSDSDIGAIQSKLPTGLFALSKTACNAQIKEAAETLRKSQLKNKLFTTWKDKTGTKNPIEWSSRYRTPILCCVSESEFGTAKRAFETLNRNWGTDAEIKAALAFLESTVLFDTLSDENMHHAVFAQFVGEYCVMLPDLNKVRDALERLSVEGDVYGWYGNPSVKSKIEYLAESEYNSGGSDKVLNIIDKMDDSQLKQYLKRLVKESMTVGIEILTSKGRQ